jgi:hypothetical protein
MTLSRLSRPWRAPVCLFVALVLALAVVPVVSSQAPPAIQLVSVSPLDEPLRIVAEARQSYQNVNDYVCTFVKREAIRGQLGPENVIQMKVRARPFSVYMKWQAPKPMEGQEVCYVVGKYNNMMRGKSPGLLGVVGFVTVDLRDPRAMQNNRHTLAEAGCGNIIERCAQRWETERGMNRTQVRIGEYEFAKRKCIRVETYHPGSKPGDFYCFRGSTYFDKETHLPIRTESYDWPRQGGPPEGELMETYSYIDVKLNVGLGEDAFNY